MPTNIEVVHQKAREYIHNRIVVLKEISEGQSLAKITRETVLAFPLSENFVRKFIMNCYIADDIVVLKEGILFWNKK